MSIQYDKPGRVWTVAEAKVRLSEILRLSIDEGPQRIGVRRGYVVVPEHVWKATIRHRASRSAVVVDRHHAARYESRYSCQCVRSRREIPFIDRRRRVNGFLLDTNVVSEQTQTEPNLNFIDIPIRASGPVDYPRWFCMSWSSVCKCCLTDNGVIC